MNADVVSVEAARAALVEAADECNAVSDLWKLSRQIAEANRKYNKAVDAYVEAVWHHLPGVTVDLPRKPYNVAVVVEERPL